MARVKDKISNALAAEIRRQIGTETMRRFVRSLPAFRPDPEIPGNMRDLLGKLDHLEKPGKEARPRG